jgi:hypothetical protein
MTYVDDAKETMMWVIESSLKSSDPNEYARYMSLSMEDKERYVRENWKKFRVNPDKDCLDRMNNVLHPLLDNATQRGATDTIQNELVAGMAKKMNNAIEFHRVLKKIVENTPDKTPRERIQLYLPSYLMLFEGAFTTEVDLIVFLLILSGRPYDRRRGASDNPVAITSFRQIRSQRMRDKLHYLEEQGFGFAISAGDYDLRNAIAHSDYTLTAEGSFRYSRRVQNVAIALSVDEMDKKHEALLREASCFQRSAMLFYSGFFKRFLTTLPESEKDVWMDKLGLDLDELE